MRRSQTRRSRALPSHYHLFAGAVPVILRAYLMAFLAVGCTPRPDPVPVSQARYMETRIFNAGYDRAMKGAINTLQDLRYTVDVIDRELGLIVASTRTEGEQARMTEEPQVTEQASTGKKILIFAVIAAIIVGIVALVTRGGGDDDDDDSYRDHDGGGHGWSYGGGRQYDGPEVYEYRLTINFQTIDSTHTRVRVSAGAQSVGGRSVRQAGAIEDPLFFERFFSRMEEALQDVGL